MRDDLRGWLPGATTYRIYTASVGEQVIISLLLFVLHRSIRHTGYNSSDLGIQRFRLVGLTIRIASPATWNSI